MPVDGEEFKDAREVAGESYRVGVRPPPFWPEEPALWFAQMEGQFVLANITADATKFYHVVAQLDHRYAAEVKEIITKPPAADKYETLKTELIKRLSASRQLKLKQLLMNEELGDRKPSQFMRHLKDLAGSDVTEEFLKTIWISRLPPNIQAIIACQSELQLEKLAEIADKVHEVVPMGSLQVASAAVPESSPSISSAQFEDMARQISELAKQVAKLTTSSQASAQPRYTRSRSRSRPRGGRSQSRSRTPQPPPGHPHCWYHFTFGARAYKCQQPCSWESENPRSSRK